MSTPKFIRLFLALLLLATFTLGVTPKKLLHTWLASHTDSKPPAVENHLNSIGVAGFHCNVDQLVAESPFDGATTALSVVRVAHCPVHHAAVLYSFFSLHHFHNELRGPPVA